MGAVLSWRLAVGAVVTVGVGLAGGPWLIAAVGGVAVWLGLAAVAARGDGGSQLRSIDPFSIGEPWRNLIMDAQSSRRRLTETIDQADDGPLRERLATIAARLDDGLADAWSIAERGDHIDEAVRRLEPTRLRADLAVREDRARSRGDDPEKDSTVTSIRSQLESVERLEQRSAEAAQQLRQTQVRLDELVAHANEVVVGAMPPATYAAEVDELVVELNALRQAVQETEGL